MNTKVIKNKIIKAKNASAELLSLSARERKSILNLLAAKLEKNQAQILSANRKDIALAKKSGRNESFIERLSLSEEKIRAMAQTAKAVARTKDRLFQTTSETIRPSGIMIKKAVYPLGLIAMIFESRPNVTIDAFSLGFKSGNAVILKGGKEIKNTNAILVGLIRKILVRKKINPSVISDLSGISQEESKEIMVSPLIDCLIPRGGKGLIDFVSDNAKVPTIITGASVVHTYVDESADLEMAVRVILNAKSRRVSICNALDVAVLHKKIADKFLSLAIDRLAEKNIELRADRFSFELLKKMHYPRLKTAGLKDFDTEFLDHILALKTVDSFSAAITHIQKHSLGHSEAIITRSKKQKEYFFKHIDAACLYHNTSTQFSDGQEFGLGGEIGISTQKLHARGPFSHEALTTYKYLVESRGATRQ